MNLSKPGRLQSGERKRLVDINKKKAEYVIVFEETAKGTAEILNVKHSRFRHLCGKRADYLQ